MFDQPDLEDLLRAALATRPEVLVRSETQVVDVRCGNAPRVLLTGGEVVRAAAVLGCDGAASVVRRAVRQATAHTYSHSKHIPVRISAMSCRRILV